MVGVSRFFLCPSCRSELIESKKALECVGCGTTYKKKDNLYSLNGEDKTNLDIDFLRFLNSRLPRYMWFKDILSKNRESFYGNILEIGAGSCAISAMIKENCDCTVFSLDKYSQILEMGYEKCELFGKRPDYFVHGDMEDPPFRDGIFSAVVGSSVLHHSRDLKAISKKIYQLLSDEGLYIGIAEPTSSAYFGNFYKKISSFRKYQEIGIPKFLNTFDGIKRAFHDAGFSYVSMKFCKNNQYVRRRFLDQTYYSLIRTVPDIIIGKILLGKVEINARK